MSPEEQAAQVTEALKNIGPQNPADFLRFIVGVWVDGGWVMIPLFILTIYIYYEATAVISYLNRAKVAKTPPETWEGWVDHPEKGIGHIGDVIRFVLAEGFVSDRILKRLEAVRNELIPGVNQKIITLSVLVTVSPLMGLLGTVIGMLTTFKGLATSSGQTVDLVAEGISVALITTQTGLMVAIPGYIFISAVIRRRNQYVGFLAHLETLLVQECASKGILGDIAPGKEPASESGS